MHSSDAEKLYDVIKEKLETRCKPINDPKVVKTLVEMGYPHKKVLKALRLRKYVSMLLYLYLYFIYLHT